MPTISIYAKATVDQALDAVEAAAKAEGFAIDDQGKSSLVVRKGNLFMSIAFGIFVAYCKVDARVKEMDDGEVRLTLEWGNPWWQGIFGPMRAKSAATGLADRIEKRIDKEGGEVLDRKGP